jgi:hypothetical protein
MEWKETRDRFDEARECVAAKPDSATRREWKIDRELKKAGVAVGRRADVDAKLNVMNMSAKRRERIVAAARREACIQYADDPEHRGRIPGCTDAFKPVFDRFAAETVLSREAAGRERKRREAKERERTHCFACEREIETVNEKGETVKNERLLVEDEFYSEWNVVCVFCGAVHRTITPLEFERFIRELFTSGEGAQRVRDARAHERGIREREREQDRVDDYVYRASHGDELRARVRVAAAVSRQKKPGEYRARNAREHRERYRDKAWGVVRVGVGRGSIATNWPVMQVTNLDAGSRGCTNAAAFFPRHRHAPDSPKTCKQ